MSPEPWTVDMSPKASVVKRPCLSPLMIRMEQGNHNHQHNDHEKEMAMSPSRLSTWVESFKSFYSVVLLSFSALIVTVAILSQQTVATGDYGIPTIVALVVYWFLIFWLAIMEGAQLALVGLQPIHKAMYAETHSLTLRNTVMAHEGGNMERYIVGRQCLVCLVVFGINIMSNAIDDIRIWGVSDNIMQIFMTSGLAAILAAIMIGQSAQVNAADCMLDFLNDYFELFTTRASLAVEYSGVLHAVYFFQMLFSKFSDNPVECKDNKRNTFFWVRVAFSLAVLCASLAVTVAALWEGKTSMWKGVPEGVSIGLFIFLMCFVGMLEGMQIALFSVINLPVENLKQHEVAYSNSHKTLAGEKLQAFLIGRQICVTCCMFVIARMTSVTVDTNAGEETIFGVSNGMQRLFNTGLLGAIITTIVGSLVWRIIASSYPIAFLSNPLIYVIIQICLLLEATGVCNVAWVLGRFSKKLIGYKSDVEYLQIEEHCIIPVIRRDKDAISQVFANYGSIDDDLLRHQPAPAAG